MKEGECRLVQEQLGSQDKNHVNKHKMNERRDGGIKRRKGWKAKNVGGRRNLRNVSWKRERRRSQKIISLSLRLHLPIVTITLALTSNTLTSLCFVSPILYSRHYLSNVSPHINACLSFPPNLQRRPAHVSHPILSDKSIHLSYPTIPLAPTCLPHPTLSLNHVPLSHSIPPQMPAHISNYILLQALLPSLPLQPLSYTCV